MGLFILSSKLRKNTKLGPFLKIPLCIPHYNCFVVRQDVTKTASWIFRFFFSESILSLTLVITTSTPLHFSFISRRLFLSVLRIRFHCRLLYEHLQLLPLYPRPQLVLRASQYRNSTMMPGQVGTSFFSLLGLLLSCSHSLGQVELPPLGYDQAALEPYISNEVSTTPLLATSSTQYRCLDYIFTSLPVTRGSRYICVSKGVIYRRLKPPPALSALFFC